METPSLWSAPRKFCNVWRRKVFASSNVVFGVGSFTYQYNTRDTFGFAMKATYGEVNGVGRPIFKQPKTDSGLKQSARGLLRVIRDGEGEYQLLDNQDWQQEQQGELKTRFLDGKLYNQESLEQIRQRIACPSPQPSPTGRGS
ncbi:putative nicotinate phosphoribosyltransferase [Serratia fonticola]|uniref:Nicotinamide phosphoribosyltransferase n=1 Tax=Serratia fonticola TaxID=47917 RepID=A0A4U9WKT3_SERFO|nr:putative nicotinate phosphoribosyltransferase [Serratia fonticola]